MRRDVIATFPVNMDIVTNKGKKKTANFIYRDITEMTNEYLINYALEHHKLGKENQTLVVIDECQIIFNPREFSRKDRLKWIVFFTQHRKLGFDFILISQFDRLIDRQIRCLIEYNIVHRKVNNFGWAWILPFKFFIAITMWNGVKAVCGREFFIYRKKFGKMYDSFMMFDDDFRGYIQQSGDKVSEHNRKILGLDKTEESIELEPIMSDDEVIAGEVDRYSQVLGENREAIEDEISEAMRIIASDGEQGSVGRVLKRRIMSQGAFEHELPELIKNPPPPDETVFTCEAPPVEAGDLGGPAEIGGDESENTFFPVRRLFNKLREVKF
jgi:hypothetical protein